MDEIIESGTGKNAAVAKQSNGGERRPADSGAQQTMMAARPMVVRDWRRPAALGYGLIVFTFVVLGGWSAVAKLDSAVTAPGIIAEENSRKSIQHLEGGIIKEIFVHEGQQVAAGQVLFRLEPTQARANLEAQQNQLDELLAEQARLIAERDRATAIAWPEELKARSDRPVVAQAISDQTKQFTDRQTSLHGQFELLQSKVAEFKTEIDGLHRERDATNEQLGFIDQELSYLDYLLGKNLVQRSRVLALDREKSRLKGLIGRSMADEAKAENGIGEAELQIQQVQNKFDEEVAASILEVRQKISDVGQKARIAQDVFQRLDITAPVSGTVQDLKVFTIGGVIKPGEELLQLVPDRDRLIVHAHISPRDVDRMWPGMRAEVRFTAFKLSTLPIISGRAMSVSRDRLVDETTKQPYFLAQVVVDEVPEELRGRLVAGMPANVVFPTGERTVLNYLVRPLQDRMNGALREQ
jgi:HlyD family secretion protein